ncbi:hypothetical protein M7I_5607 [Glarea lozoyensis 74030]|uniref:Uncharacterized protein n=1 Tax=Glarea lozoyensis (strain ATCC 74030 / MF5533) TaxID=1104152 RepID=H0ESC8_GLAL7|nr:hypothetical protein M7I_5607 [Glarea lozoyensis 74030]
MKFQIYSQEIGSILVSQIDLNTTGNIRNFSLAQFPPRLTPYPITLYATIPGSTKTFKSTTEIYVLPSRTYGSAVKIDNLHGGLLVQNNINKYKGWYPIFPNGHYVDGGYLTPSTFDLTHLNTYAAQGFNTINIVPDGGRPDQAYPIDSLSKYWDRLDELNLFNIYDMRFAFQNSTRISDQVALWKDRTSLLMWYTADEPDGWVYALNSTKLAYDQLRELDPYHPVSLVLNCQDFYYEEYAAGADLIWQDAYPVGINATHSIPWGTVCNTTYGDCGCDNCVGSLTDVATRLDDIQAYQAAIPYALQKPTWSVIQAFGEQSYWPRLPKGSEVLNMMMLSNDILIQLIRHITGHSQ